jgi:hypothetical protein
MLQRRLAKRSPGGYRGCRIAGSDAGTPFVRAINAEVVS